jgi:hypothetical protein
MSEQEQAKFDGWAIVDVLGHQRYVGYVHTEAYGQAVMFRVDVPSLPEREYALKEPQYVNDGSGFSRWAPVGSLVKRAATPGYTKLIGAGSIYSISPCDEAAGMEAIELTQRPELKLISRPEDAQKALAAAPRYDNDDDDDDHCDWDDEDEELDADEREEAEEDPRTPPLRSSGSYTNSIQYR